MCAPGTHKTDTSFLYCLTSPPPLFCSLSPLFMAPAEASPYIASFQQLPLSVCVYPSVVLPFLWLLMLILICCKCWENTRAFNLNGMKGTSNLAACNVFYSLTRFRVTSCLPPFAKMTQLYVSTLLCCILPAAVIIGRKTGEIYQPRSISCIHRVCQSGCGIIVPQHKSSSASGCSRRSFCPSSFPVGAIFNLLQCASTSLVATWMFWLCHRCRLG